MIVLSSRSSSRRVRRAAERFEFLHRVGTDKVRRAADAEAQRREREEAAALESCTFQPTIDAHSAALAHHRRAVEDLPDRNRVSGAG